MTTELAGAAGAQVVLRVTHAEGCSCPLKVKPVELVPFTHPELATRYQKVLDARCDAALVPSVDDVTMGEGTASPA